MPRMEAPDDEHSGQHSKTKHHQREGGGKAAFFYLRSYSAVDRQEQYRI